MVVLEAVGGVEVLVRGEVYLSSAADLSVGVGVVSVALVLRSGGRPLLEQSGAGVAVGELSRRSGGRQWLTVVGSEQSGVGRVGGRPRIMCNGR